MNRFAYISSTFILCIFPIIGSSQVLIELAPGVTVEPSNINEIARTSVPYARIRKADRVYKGSDRSSSVAAFFGPIGDDKYFGLMRTGVLHAVDIPNDEYVGSWPLTRWEGEYLEPEVPERYRQYGLERTEPSVKSSSGRLGCVFDSPLRYGDFTGDGRDELVLLFDGELLVFSPEQGETLFSTVIRINDWLDRDRTESYLRGGEASEKPQYQSVIAAAAVGNLQGAHEAGYRGYAKLYKANFNDDERTDLIVWRKFYVSLYQDDPVNGFEKLKDELLHYEFVDGEYVRRETDEVTIRAWLTEQELTWAEGYPNRSECEDEEGQLIPEMHDPLLNDPDVLEGVDPETMTFIEAGAG